MYELIVLSVKCSVVGYVYANVLVKPGEALAWWGRFLEKMLVKETFGCSFERKESWLYKPLLGCARCVSGQIALWSSVLSGNYDPWEIIFIICATIFLVLIYDRVIKG